MLAVIVFIIILGVLIFVHELGHFVTARKNGIKADEFGFGFPPRIVGIQFLSGRERQKTMELESAEVQIASIKSGKKEEVTETFTEKMRQVSQIVPVKKWRLIWGNKDGDSVQEEEDLKEAHKKKFAGGTIYSLNWIPLGGFVKIKGEDGSAKNETNSFANKSAWTRVKVLAAGVAMNFVLAWFLISAALMIGAPQPVDSITSQGAITKIQISEIAPDSPANEAGFKVGDEILKTQTVNGKTQKVENINAFQDYINASKGNNISIQVMRGDKALEFKITPRINPPEDEGPLGVALAETSIVSYSWYQSIWIGLKTTIGLIGAIFVALTGIIYSLFMGQGVGVDVAGPVGIAVLTKQVTGLGLVYILQFAALLSINLGIINILPFPALDGGRILFVIIEKIKGSPVSQRIEQTFHTIGFVLLILLLILISFRDVTKFIK